MRGAAGANPRGVNGLQASVGGRRRWIGGCYVAGMTLARLIDRVRAEFVEMPGLELTLPQAARLWNLSPEDCRSVLDVLTNAGFLRWTTGRTVVRTGRDLQVAYDEAACAVRVGQTPIRDKSVAAA